MKKILILFSFLVAAFSGIAQNGTFQSVRLINGTAAAAGAINGRFYYNTSTNEFQFYQNGSWVGLGSVGGGTWGSITGTLSSQTDLYPHLIKFPFSNNNTFGGINSGNSITSGDQNTGFGLAALRDVTSGQNNVGFGWNALVLTSTGQGNTGIGTNALQGVTTSDYNLGLGHDAGANMSTGYRNVLVGAIAGSFISTGSDNIGIGYAANNSINTASGNIVIGNSVDVQVSGNDNQLSIQNAIFGLGNSYSTSTSIASGNIGIYKTAPTARLHVIGGTATHGSFAIDAGTLLATPVKYFIEPTKTHIYWTDSLGTRYQLDQQSASVGDAAADGTTKGIAAFTAADFNSSSGVISLDYTNGQKATTSIPGFLSATDWTTFNSKVSGSSFNLTSLLYASGTGTATTDVTLNFDGSSKILTAKFLTLTQTTTKAPISLGGFATDPSSPTEGELSYNLTSHLLKYYNGSAWTAPGGISTTLTSAHILVGNGSNVATDVAVSGDLTLANTGAFTIGSQKVGISKMTMNTAKMLGRTTASTGAVEEIAVGDGLTFGSTTLKLGGDYANDITLSSSSKTFTISSGVVFSSNSVTQFINPDNFNITILDTFLSNQISLDISITAGFVYTDGLASPIGITYSGTGYETTDNSLTSRGYVLGDKIFTGKQSFTQSGTDAGLRILGTSSDPSNTNEGELSYNTTTHLLKYFNGTSWIAPLITLAIGNTITSGTTGSILYLGASNVLAQDNANFFWESTNHRLGLGNNAPATVLHTATTSTGLPRGPMFDQYSTGTESSRAYFRKSRGTFGSKTTIVTGDVIGNLTFSGYEGSAFSDAAEFRVTSTGTISAGIVGGIMTLRTASATTGTLATAISIGADQKSTFTQTTTTSPINLTGFATDPSSPVEGEISYNTTSHLLKFYNGTSWIGPGSGTVTSVSVVTAQGVSGSVATSTTTPAITLTLGALTGVTSFNGLVVTANTGVVTTGTWNGSVLGAAYGGTGIANNAASTLTISGNFGTTLTVSGTTSVTLPTSGTLATTVQDWHLTGTSTLTGVATITSNAINQLLFAGTFTASASTDELMSVAGTLTANSGGGVKGLLINPAFTASGTSSTQIALDVLPTFTGGTTPVNIALRTQTGAVVLGNTAPQANTHVTINTNGFTQALSIQSAGSQVLVLGASISHTSAQATFAGSAYNLTFTGSNNAALNISGFNLIGSQTQGASWTGNVFLYLANPTLNTNASANGSFYGFYHNPTVTQIGTSKNYGFVSSAASLNGYGTATPHSTEQVNGSWAGGYIAKTANYTLTVTDYAVNCTANSFTITLPSAVGIAGRVYIVKNTGTATTITIATTSSQTIDGTTPVAIATITAVRYMSDGANWIII